MATIGIILLTIGVFSILPLRLTIRKKMMRRLANEFRLKFNSNPPKFIDFYFKFLVFSPDWRINYLDGVINGHKIHIYDNIFSGPRILKAAFNYEKNHTIIEIDNEYIKGKEDKYKTLKFQDSYLTSIWELRKLLSSLKND